MKILAVTCYTGGEELCRMTSRMLYDLVGTPTGGANLVTSVVAQGATAALDIATLYFVDHPENVGFGFGMNLAIDNGVRLDGEPDYVLCLNNDLEFPNKNWLKVLLKEVSPNYVFVPATDKAAIVVQKGPMALHSIAMQEMSGYCWLVPFKWCQWLKKEHGFWLFSEEFGSYGEDNWTAFLLSKQYGQLVFRYVRRSWVKHLRGRTAAVVKPNRRQSSRVLIAKFKAQLASSNLRGDLREWAKRYIATLKTRT